MSSESSTKSGLDEASTSTQPERPPPKHVFGGHEDDIYSFVFLHDNVHIVSGSWDGTMRKWDCKTGLLVSEPWKGEGGRIWALALSPDGKTIACGRDDGSVQRWNTHGEMSEGVWMGHSSVVQSVSWAPNGGHIASGSDDGTILIRKAENGEVDVGPIKTGQGWVTSVAYSPSGDRIASGGQNETICIWDSKTGELLVGPIEDLRKIVTSVVWSLDSSKLYSASDKFARVFDSVSGTKLHRSKHNYYLNSVALSPKHNVLACVGYSGVAQLWGTESYQPLGKPFDSEHGVTLRYVSFSRDGRYLAYAGDNKKIILWIVKDIAPELPSPSSSFLEVDATNPFAQPGGDDIEDGHDNLYGDFFQSSEPSHLFEANGSSRPSQWLRNLLSPGRLWNIFIPSRHALPADQSIPLQPHIKRSFFAWHTGPQPVTVSAGRPRKLYWIAPRRRVLQEDQNVEEVHDNVNAQAGQSSSAAAQPSSATAPCLIPQEPSQAQSAPRPAQEDELDYGCWGNFWYAVCCMSVRHRGIMPAVQPTAS